MRFDKLINQLLKESVEPARDMPIFKIVSLQLIGSTAVLYQVIDVHSTALKSAIYDYHLWEAYHYFETDPPDPMRPEYIKYAEDQTARTMYSDDNTVGMLSTNEDNIIQFAFAPQNKYYHDIENLLQNSYVAYCISIRYDDISPDELLEFFDDIPPQSKIVTQDIKRSRVKNAQRAFNYNLSSREDAIFDQDFLDGL